MTNIKLIPYPKSTRPLGETKKIYVSDIQSTSNTIRVGSKIRERCSVISGLGYDVCEKLGVIKEYKTLKGI